MSAGYHGPLVRLTLAEAAALLPPGPADTPERISATRKIQTALAASPVWRTPTT